MALPAQTADDRGGRITHEREQGVSRGDPHAHRCHALEERGLALATRGLLHGSTNPVPTGHRPVKGRGTVIARERPRQGGALWHGVAVLVGAPRQPGKAAREPREAQRSEGLRDLGGIERGELGVREPDVERHVRANGGHRAGEQGVVDMCAEVLAHLALDLVRMGNDLVEAAILHDEGRSLLGTYARHAGDVV